MSSGFKSSLPFTFSLSLSLSLSPEFGDDRTREGKGRDGEESLHDFWLPPSLYPHLPPMAVSANGSSSSSSGDGGGDGSAGGENGYTPMVVDLEDWTYAYAPDIPEWGYDLAFSYMVAVGSFGVVSNLAIVFAFCRRQAVSEEK